MTISSPSTWFTPPIRGQIMSALRIMGKEGVGTDYLFYLSHLKNTK